MYQTKNKNMNSVIGLVVCSIGSLGCFIKYNNMSVSTVLNIIKSGKDVSTLLDLYKRQDDKGRLWFDNAYMANYEGAGFIPYYMENDKKISLMGLNKKNQVEYPGGKVEKVDYNEFVKGSYVQFLDTFLFSVPEHLVVRAAQNTAKREFFEEFLNHEDEKISSELKQKFNMTMDQFDPLVVNSGRDGTTKKPAFLFQIKLTTDQYKLIKENKARSIGDGTFSKIIEVETEQLKNINIKDKNIKIKTTEGVEYELRNFNKFLITKLNQATQ